MKKLLLIFLLLSITFSSYSNIRRICNVQYKTEDGWSKYYKMEVQFVTGSELNKMTTSYKYSTYLNYCLLWFEKGEVAILEITDYLSDVGEYFERNAFRSAFSFRRQLSCKQVNAEQKREWRIEAKNMIEFIDPIENDD